jgi:hypothetical protein
MDSSTLTSWKEKNSTDTLSTTIQRTAKNKDDVVDCTLVKMPPSKSTHLAGLAKINPPGVGFVWFTRESKDMLIAIDVAQQTKMFKKVRPNLKVNEETVEHEELGSIDIPLIPKAVFNLREEGKKVLEDATSYWNAIGTTRHSAPMNSHSQHPDRKDLKKLKNRSLHKAWSEFKQSQYCTSISLGPSAYQIFSQCCVRLERVKWDLQAKEKKRKMEENGEVEEEPKKEEPKRKKRRR